MNCTVCGHNQSEHTTEAQVCTMCGCTHYESESFVVIDHRECRICHHEAAYHISDLCKLCKCDALTLYDLVDHPQHYGGDTTYEAIKVIEAWNLNFNLGNVVKYIARADHKGSPLDDLRKALWYLNREIENVQR